MKSKEAEEAQKKTYWQEHIQAWEQSGLSQADFSLALSTFQSCVRVTPPRPFNSKTLTWCAVFFPRPPSSHLTTNFW